MGILDDLFGTAPEGNYETKDTTTFIETIFGERSAEVRDKRTDEVGRGKGDNAKDAKSNAFHHLKEASPYDPNYTPGPKSQEDSSSSGSYSGGGDWSSGGGGSNTPAGLGGLLGLIGAIVLGGVTCWSIFEKNSKPSTPQPKPRISYSAQQGTSPDLSLEENIARLSSYLEQNNQLSGNFRNYVLVKTPTVIRDANKTNIRNQTYEIAFVAHGSVYVFHSSNGGITWGPMPPRDPFLLKFCEEYSRENQNQWKKSHEKKLEEMPVQIRESTEGKDLDEVIEEDIRASRRMPSNKIDSFEVQIENPPKVSKSQAEPEQTSDYFENKDEEKSREESIRKRYDQIYNQAMIRRNRFKSKFTIEQQVRENMERELRSRIPNREQ